MFEAYWSFIDWKAFAAAAGVIGTIASPYIVNWWTHRGKQLETAAQVAENAAARVERIQNIQYERIEGERDYQIKRADRAEAETEEMTLLARGMEEWAHWYRHGWANVHIRYEALLAMFTRLANGDLTVEVAQTIITQARGHMPQPPPFVPLLREAAQRLPGPKPTTPDP